MMATSHENVAPTYPSDKIRWSKKYGNTADVSDLEFGWGRAWNDSYDVGFRVVSRKTGKTKTFILKDAMTNGEGEIANWTFVAVNDHELTIVVFND